MWDKSTPVSVLSPEQLREFAWYALIDDWEKRSGVMGPVKITKEIILATPLLRDQAKKAFLGCEATIAEEGKGIFRSVLCEIEAAEAAEVQNAT